MADFLTGVETLLELTKDSASKIDKCRDIVLLKDRRSKKESKAAQKAIDTAVKKLHDGIKKVGLSERARVEAVQKAYQNGIKRAAAKSADYQLLLHEIADGNDEKFLGDVLRGYEMTYQYHKVLKGKRGKPICSDEYIQQQEETDIRTGRIAKIFQRVLSLWKNPRAGSACHLPLAGAGRFPRSERQTRHPQRQRGTHPEKRPKTWGCLASTPIRF